jgi:hypothetical protein
MSEWERRAFASGDMRGPASSNNWSFWLTLIVTTFLVALTAYVLSGAMFDPTPGAPGRRASSEHSRSVEFSLPHNRGTLSL